MCNQIGDMWRAAKAQGLIPDGNTFAVTESVSTGTGGGHMTMTTVDAQEIARLRELHAALTPGEWSVRPATHLVVRGPWIVVSVSLSSDEESQATAAYIATAHNALPDVLDALEQARAERDAALAELAQVRTQLATVDDFGADCYEWGLDNKTWRPDFREWLTWKVQEAL